MEVGGLLQLLSGVAELSSHIPCQASLDLVVFLSLEPQANIVPDCPL